MRRRGFPPSPPPQLFIPRGNAKGARAPTRGRTAVWLPASPSHEWTPMNTNSRLSSRFQSCGCVGQLTRLLLNSCSIRVHSWVEGSCLSGLIALPPEPASQLRGRADQIVRTLGFDSFGCFRGVEPLQTHRPRGQRTAGCQCASAGQRGPAKEPASDRGSRA